MKNSDILQLKNFCVTYNTNRGKLCAVNNVNLRLKYGNTLAIVGESGCGKSSLAFGLMKLFNKKDVSISGDLIFAGENLISANEKKMQLVRGKKMAMVFQNPMTSLNPYLKIGTQVIEHAQRHLGLSKNEAKNQAISLLNKVGIQDAASGVTHYPYEFSGGMRQRSMIASAIACSPELIIADEPTTALDVTTQAQILELLSRNVQQNNMSMIIITHDLGIVSGLCKNIVVMYAGTIVEEGTVYDVFSNPKHPYTRSLLKAIPQVGHHSAKKLCTIKGKPPDLVNYVSGPCVFSPRCDYSKPVCDEKNPEVVRCSNSHHYRCHFDLIPESEGDDKNSSFISNSSHKRNRNIILSIENLEISYEKSKKRNAVDNVSLELFENEILGIAGESGSGKSTLIKGILRLVTPASGKILFNDKDITKLHDNELINIRRSIQMIFQDPYSSLNPRLNAWKNIAEPLINYENLRGKKARIEAEKLIEIVGLDEHHSECFPHEFSGGQRQRLGIARALAVKPKILLCDEPVSSLDVSIQAQILNLIKELHQSLNLTLIFISHDLSVINCLADRVAVMLDGKIVELADTETLYKNPTHKYTQQLFSAIPGINSFTNKPDQ